MIELIFVIVVMGIIGKFGTEFLVQAYNSFIFSNVNNTLQSNSAMAVEFISTRLQNRIKDSVIARTTDGAAPVSIGSASGNTYTILEWVASDVDGFRGSTKPLWSGIIDLDQVTTTRLISPDTNSTAINNLISTLSYGTKGIQNAALYFVGSNSNVDTYGWNATTPIIDQTFTMHPITAGIALNDFNSSIAGVNFAGDIYEYYKLAWTANAIVYTAGADNMGTLTYWYNYQPWNGDNYTNGNPAIIMEGVSTFQFMSIGSIIKIQVCAKSTLLNDTEGGDYSLCKEKTVF
jgi:hypothetical protein